MTKRDNAVLAFRILAVYLIVTNVGQALSAVVNITILSQQFETAVGPGQKGLIVAASLFPFVIGLLIWLLADPLATKATWDIDDQESETEPFADLRAIAFSAIGAFFLVQAATELPGMFFGIFGQKTSIDRALLISGPVLIKVSLAILLLLGSSRLAGTIRKARTAGLSVPEDSEES